MALAAVREGGGRRCAGRACAWGRRASRRCTCGLGALVDVAVGVPIFGAGERVVEERVPRRAQRRHAARTRRSGACRREACRDGRPDSLYGTAVGRADHDVGDAGNTTTTQLSPQLVAGSARRPSRSAAPPTARGLVARRMPPKKVETTSIMSIRICNTSKLWFSAPLKSLKPETRRDEMRLIRMRLRYRMT